MEPKINQTATAEVMGCIAFNSNKKRIPALDTNFCELIYGNKIGGSIPALNAWMRGWDNANLAK